MDSKKLEYYTITLDKTSSKLDLNVDDNTSILDYLNSSSRVDITPKGSKINLSKPTSNKAILKEHHLGAKFNTYILNVAKNIPFKAILKKCISLLLVIGIIIVTLISAFMGVR